MKFELALLRDGKSRFDRQFEMAYRSDAIVLITGPTGAGKTTLAEKIHRQSARAAKPFVSVNLASLHEGTIESELFGHERGAFTGADQKRIGKFEIANGGTVFLDEIGELPPKFQARLLEVLQSKSITPIGSNRSVKLDIRIIVATHRNLEVWVEEGRFREDLFHRLRMIELPLKSLCLRRNEFDQILHATIEDVSRELRKKIYRLEESVAEAFETYAWPGNIRELRNVVHYAVLSSEDGVITLEDLPMWFIARWGAAQSENPIDYSALGVRLPTNYHQAMDGFERFYLTQMLWQFHFQKHAAHQIGISEATFKRRVKSLKLKVAVDSAAKSAHPPLKEAEGVNVDPKIKK